MIQHFSVMTNYDRICLASPCTELSGPRIPQGLVVLALLLLSTPYLTGACKGVANKAAPSAPVWLRRRPAGKKGVQSQTCLPASQSVT